MPVYADHLAGVLTPNVALLGPAGAPERAAVDRIQGKDFRTTASDFQIDPKIDDALFSTDPPPGYAIRKGASDTLAMDDKTFLNPEKAAEGLLREFAKKSGGAFPKKLDDLDEFSEMFPKKEKPGTLNVGTINVGGTQNLTAELFKAMAGIDVVIVPFRGSPDVVVALLRNDVQLAIDFYAALKPTLDGGKARVIATSAPKRSPELPNVPTVQEGGVAGFDVTAWNGLYAPAGTLDAILQALIKILVRVLLDGTRGIFQERIALGLAQVRQIDEDAYPTADGGLEHGAQQAGKIKLRELAPGGGGLHGGHGAHNGEDA